LALHFSGYSFLVHHPVNWDDRQLLAHAMASDFTVAWQFSQREQLFCNVSNSTPESRKNFTLGVVYTNSKILSDVCRVTKPGTFASQIETLNGSDGKYRTNLCCR
jgi:hypothetical protein